MSLRRRAQTLIGGAADRWTRWRVARRIERGTLGPLAVVPYPGWGNREHLHVGARVLEDKGLSHGAPSDPWWRNAIAVGRRFMSDEIPGAELQVTIGGVAHRAVTDAEGFAWLTLANPQPEWHGWVETSWQVRAPTTDGPPVAATGHVLVAHPDAAFGVISDLDDTVLRTGVTDTTGMLRTVLFNNARTRLPFPGVSAFYRALRSGGSAARNPIFYVSTSPWNLFDVIDEFLRFHAVPIGPMFLTDWGLGPTRLGQPDGHQHKVTAIRRLLDAHPTTDFLLVGDSGQHDPEIYRDVALEYPGRIRAVYIRDVRLPGRTASVDAITAELAAVGVPLVHGHSTLDAARHALACGFIDASGLAAVEAAAERGG